MLPNSKSIKTAALGVLKDNWLACIAASLIPFMLSFFTISVFEMLYSLSNGIAVKIISIAVTAIIILFFLLPVFFGTLRVFRNLADGGKIYISEIFIYFTTYKRYRRLMKAVFILALRLLFTGFVLFLPSAVIEFAAGGGFDFLMGNATPIWFTNLWVIALFFRCLAFAILLFVALSYYLLPYVLIINDDIDVLEAIYLSSKAAKYSTASFLGLFISFLGWILLCLLAIPIMFVLPYMIMCYVVHSYHAVKVYNYKITPQSESSFVENDFRI